MPKAIALNCTLKDDPNEASSTDAMIAVLKKAFAERDVEVTETVRVAALNIKPGVTSDEGDGDDWPALRAKILDHDILILGGPIWMGQVGSVAKRVMERAAEPAVALSVPLIVDARAAANWDEAH